jgi:predicted dehydrogenase
LRTTTRFDDLLDDRIDAVVIATPVSTHEELVAAAVAADKHVFVEKPLTQSWLTAHRLIDEAEQRGVVLMPGHTFLYSPPVLMIGELIQSGQLGEIYFITSSRVNLGLHQPDVSVTWDLGPHDFSILCYWLGALPSSVSAVSRGCVVSTLPDVAFISLEFPSGTIAHVELSWLAPSKLRRTAIVGSEKMVVYDDTSNEAVRIFDSGVVPPSPQTFGEFKMSYRSGDVVSPKVDASEPLVHEMLDFCLSIRTGTQPRSNGALGLDVIRVCEAVDRSLARGAPVHLSDLRSPEDAFP